MPDDRTVDFVVMFLVFGMVGLGLLSMFVGWVVNLIRGGDDEITSSDAPSPPAYAPSDLRTGPDQGPDRTPAPSFDKAKLLDTYRRLRALGASRNAARELLQIWGIPLHNDLWAKAAPDEEPQITPIAHRPTAAKFHDDPELEYQPLR